jgi:predicted O-methyltransferase YrrM
MRARTRFLKLRCRVTVRHLLDRWRPPPSGDHTANELTHGPETPGPFASAWTRLGRDTQGWARASAEKSVPQAIGGVNLPAGLRSWPVDSELRDTLDRLYAEGTAYDGAQTDRRRRRRNLEPEAASFLWLLLQAVAARTVVEVGTSNGYSTIWLADAVRRTAGRVVSLDVDAAAQGEAARNLEATGLARYVDLRLVDGGDFLAQAPPSSVDVLFLDAERPEYSSWWPDPKLVLRPGGLLVIDNVESHPDEVADILRLIDADEDLTSSVVSIGKGQLLAVKRPDSGQRVGQPG